ADAGAAATKLLERFSAAFHIGGRDVYLTASIGIALSPADADTPDALLHNADTAMYQSKHAGRNTYHFFTTAMIRDIARHLNVEQRLRLALQRDGLEVAFQPLVHLPSDKVVGAEALARWHDSELGTMAPDEFVPIAEQTGLIGAVGRHVMDAALMQAARWRWIYRNDFRVSVNVSPQQFREGRIVDDIDAALERAGLPGDALEIEITEGVLLDGQEYVDRALAALRGRGVTIAMDDFGTGYASLSYVRDYPFDSLKIDRAFVQGVDVHAEQRSLLETTLRMAKGLGLRTVAEGVETAAELAVLRQENCELAQGFLFAAPLSASDFEVFMSRAEA
ncbi:MAG: bifunctional diguanylate cyclase/phosphodiesterase, partial [Halofilum sp. (in: g-proteobacteria)]